VTLLRIARRGVPYKRKSRLGAAKTVVVSVERQQARQTRPRISPPRHQRHRSSMTGYGALQPMGYDAAYGWRCP